jgi:oligoribonuclease (3'-5' exoribonuclease)
MKYVAIDTETTGLSDKCSLLEVAMVFEDTEKKDVPVEDLPLFYMLCDISRGAYWETAALTMHLMNGLYQELTAPGSRFRSVDEVGVLGATWLRQQAFGASDEHKYGSIVAAGKNFTSFDRRFLPPTILEMLHYRAIEVGSVFVDFDTATGPSMAAIVGGDHGAKAHRAIEDARDVVRVLRRKYT